MRKICNCNNLGIASSLSIEVPHKERKPWFKGELLLWLVVTGDLSLKEVQLIRRHIGHLQDLRKGWSWILVHSRQIGRDKLIRNVWYECQSLGTVDVLLVERSYHLILRLALLQLLGVCRKHSGGSNLINGTHDCHHSTFHWHCLK